jgi:hypothetical protein
MRDRNQAEGMNKDRQRYPNRAYSQIYQHWRDFSQLARVGLRNRSTTIDVCS